MTKTGGASKKSKLRRIAMVGFLVALVSTIALPGFRFMWGRDPQSLFILVVWGASLAAATASLFAKD